jgi:2,3-dihydroxy-2,3-dihydrophenylpropionate dehydrogenase/cis-2,3-dihydrobiphenyl-2,3-diol dehydrogenase
VVAGARPSAALPLNQSVNGCESCPRTASALPSRALSLNVKAYLLGAKAAVEPLRRTKDAIIFTASNAGFWPGGGGLLYMASKHAVVGLVKQLAYELAPDIRVNGHGLGGQLAVRGERTVR